MKKLLPTLALGLLTLVTDVQAAPFTNVIDVHFTFTTERKNNYGSLDRTLGIMRQSQGILNKAHADGGTGCFFNFTRPREIPNNWQVGPDNQGISQLQNNQVPGAFTTRDQIGADMVGLNASIGPAGLAFRGNPFGYAVRFLSGPATAHEIGHTFGCGHGGDNGGGPSDGGDTPYARGWAVRNAAGTRFGTVMTGAQIVRYSTPVQTFDNQPIGNAARADNRRRIIETRIEASRQRRLIPTAFGTKYAVHNRAENNIIEVPGDNPGNGVQLGLWNALTAAHNQWTFGAASVAGWLKMRNVGTGLFASVDSGSTANGARIVQAIVRTEPWQELRPVWLDSGICSLQFRNSNKFIRSGNGDRGTRLTLSPNGSDVLEQYYFQDVSFSFNVIVP